MQQQQQQLRVNNLSLERSGRQILSDINFALKEGEALLLRGDNGVGKTSLLMSIAGYLHINSGEIEWEIKRDTKREEGEEWGEEEENLLIKNLHFIGHQQAIKPHLTLEENLLFWCQLYGGEEKWVQEALIRVGLANAISYQAALLSAGQSKRLSLARLLVANRPIWLLDEPSSALDKNGDKLVADLIDEHLDGGGIAIIATHLNIELKNKKRIKTLMLKAI